MKIRFKKLISSIRTPEGKRALSIFFVCLIFSSLAWLTIKLSRQNQVQYNYNVKVANVSRDYFISPIGNPELQIKYRATGAKFLFSGMYTMSDEIKIDFSQFLRVSRSGETRFYITSQRIEQLLLADLGPTMEIISIWPDTLFYKARKAIEKKVPVYFDQSKIEFSQGFRLYGNVIVEPDSVFLRIPINDASKVDSVFVETNGIKGVEKDVILSLPLRIDAEVNRFEINPKNVNVAIPVEKYTELSIGVFISVFCDEEILDKENYPELRLLPEKVTINALVALKDYNNINPDMFFIAVDCADFLPKTKMPKLKVKLLKTPDNVIVNSISPESVDYILLK